MSSLASSLGIIAGCLWMLGAVYLQLIRDRQCYWKIPFLFTFIGLSILLASTGPLLPGRPGTVEVLAIVGNVIAIVIAPVAIILADEFGEMMGGDTASGRVH